jgi:hypothetical protein
VTVLRFFFKVTLDRPETTRHLVFVYRKQLGLARGHPFARCRALALGAVPVATAEHRVLHSTCFVPI